MSDLSNVKKLKDTVFLPKTNFAMQANLTRKEPSILEMWKHQNLFNKLRGQSRGNKKFILHFGPPYANGHIHMGHALIGILKDVVNKSFQMLGYDAPLVPGWDCHGLPIEWKIEEGYLKEGKKREEVPVIEFLSKCREFAYKWKTIQCEEFEKLGIIADFEHPYCTMDKESEAIICEKFFEIVKKNLVYQGRKPIMWSVVERTALAEAELEYMDKVSDAIFVKFPVKSSNIEELIGAFAVIWTTTPWTIPANKAIAYSEDIEYSVVKINCEKYLVASKLIASFVKEIKADVYEVINIIPGRGLANTVCVHPLKDIGFSGDIPLLPANHVTDDSGTGLVHTAPAHGLDDFILGKKFNLEILDIVTDDGKLIDGLPAFSGEHVFKVNDKIIEALRDSGNLVYNYKITHSYPHSWRSKAPLIFRTTSQWFISIDRIRNTLINEIDRTKWFPEGYINRIRSMVEQRPDWCISRQRLWGVPIALFVNKKTNKVLQDEDVFSRIVETFRAEGIESWHKYPDSYFLCDKYDPEDFYKVKDTLEVWFDSACSNNYVLEQRPDLDWPADLYFEGSDQHRGWFQSSLVVSCCVNGKAPYKQVATNGFVLDKDGKKMSKSLGNVISPEDVTKKNGTDILRLWCINSDYSEDLRIGDEILKQHEDVYRRFRNTLRYLLGVLSDYSESDVIKYDELPELEKWMLHQLSNMDSLLERCIKNYDFQTFYIALHSFCVNTLSAFYFDIRKDSIYCDSKDSLKRRSCLYVMNEIFLCLIHWLAPVLSFTAEEAWASYMPEKSKSSIHLNLFHSIGQEWANPQLDETWTLIRHVRKVITGALEIERLAKTIGSSLEAEIVVYSRNQDTAQILRQIDLAEIAIVSKVTVLTAAAPSNAVKGDDNDDIGIIVKIASAKKCQRCWRFSDDVSIHQDSVFGMVELCERCISVMGG